MGLSKRSLIILCLGWLVSIVLTSFVAGYYYMVFQKEAQLSREYADMYNELMPNYTSLLNDHLTLSSKYTDMYEFMQNYTNLMDEYLELTQLYELEKQNLTELHEKYGSYIVLVSICIDYKEWNGTVIWHNDTIVPLGCNLLQATKTVAVVNYTYWPAYQASFVDAINGVWNHGAYFWMWLRWNSEREMWEYGDYGADRYTLTKGDIVMWQYEIPSYP